MLFVAGNFRNFASLWSQFHFAGSSILISAGALLVGFVQLIERRGGKIPEVTPSRQIDISTLLESMPEAVFVFDHAGSIVEVNHAAERLFHANREEIKQFTGQAIAGFLASNPEGSVDPKLAVVYRSLHGETVRQERRVLTLPDHGLSPEVLLSANPICDTKGRVAGALVVVRDITELSTLQRRMADTERHNAIGKMAAALAHDFNNVLQTISQAATVLEMEDGRTTAERNVITRMIHNAVKRGTEITASVRQYLATGASESQDVDLNEVLEEAIELTRPLWQANRGVSIMRHFQPVSHVSANAADLRRIFTNLVMNALEAMSKGGTLSVGCEQQGNSVCAFVADSGEGIAPERYDRIFHPYFTTKPGGTGLGLSNARNTIQNMGGRLTFQSQLGRGTRFEVQLPTAMPQRKTA